MLPSGLVIPRDVNPEPAEPVVDSTVLAAMIRSFAPDVVIDPLLVALLPLPLTAASTTLDVAIPLYSAIRTSG